MTCAAITTSSSNLHARLQRPCVLGLAHTTDVPGPAPWLPLLLPSPAQAIAGCAYVYHVASPFFIESDDPQRDLIDPALLGTRNVLASAARHKASVRRVVVTSSVAGGRLIACPCGWPPLGSCLGSLPAADTQAASASSHPAAGSRCWEGCAGPQAGCRACSPWAQLACNHLRCQPQAAREV